MLVLELAHNKDLRTHLSTTLQPRLAIPKFLLWSESQSILNLE